MESFVSIQRQINSLASVALQNRRALDLFTTEKGGTCLFLGEDCCYFVNETGIVQGRVKELRDRTECHRKELQTLYSPQNLFQQVLPWLLPFLGPLVLIILFLLFIYSSYLDPVSSISFKGFSKNGFGPSLKITSRPFFFSRASPQA